MAHAIDHTTNTEPGLACLLDCGYSVPNSVEQKSSYGAANEGNVQAHMVEI